MLTTHYAHGAPSWLDLGCSHPGASAAFYSGLFDWDMRPLGPEAGGYGFFQLDGRTVAALSPSADESSPPAWMLFFQADDADATAKAVEQAGGTVRFGPFDVFTNGRTAGFTDPGGADFSVWQPAGTRGLDLVTEPGSLCWAELFVPDPAAAIAFYGSVLDWQAQEVPFGDSGYTVLSTSDGSTTLGAVVRITDEMGAAGVVPRWLPYFEVTDCDAVVRSADRLGGSVVMAPQHTEGVGRFAHLADPGGAVFAVIASQPRRS
ncbi:VOC family protein [Streptomyces sp. NPDC046977]|uniref:VOC family protein n=1 Tax=Streptomyces sp. NPDC046977 TaxID=3154703 RepID=UPI00340B42A6